MAEASVESGIAEAGAVRAMAAPVVGAVALLVALLAVETLGAAWEQHQLCHKQKDNGETKTQTRTHHPGTGLH